MKILAVSGSLQQRSVNSALLRAATTVLPAGLQMDVFTGLGDLPHFNPDLDGEGAPGAVGAWRAGLAGVDGVLIACPEFAHGMPGVLKNALDWVVGSGELVGKPTALMSASPGPTGGIRALLALTQTLTAMSVPVIDVLNVTGVRPKLDAAGEVGDAATRARIGLTLQALAAEIALR
jgi:NAD(P)H-dependent FMN reductase